MSRISALFAAVTFACARPALACSLIWANFGQPELPPDMSRVGPMPLFTEPTVVRDTTGQPVDVVPATSLELDGALNDFDEPVALFTPAAPMAPGAYTKSFSDGSGEVRFTVVDAASADPVPVVEAADLRLIIRRPVESGGCPGMRSSCEGTTVTKLDVRVEMPTVAEPRRVTLLVELSSDLGNVAYLARPGFSGEADGAIIGFHHDVPEVGSLEDDRICVRVTPLSPEGTLGATVDAGCVDPNDGDDPRVDDYRDDGGCSAIGGVGGQQDPLLVGMLLLLAWRRRRIDSR